MVKKTLYDVLQVSRDAEPETIKAAYKSLVQRYHPDKNPDNPDAEMHLKKINHAYDVLSDPVQRAEYEAALVGLLDNPEMGYSARWYGYANLSMYFGLLIALQNRHRLCKLTQSLVTPHAASFW